MIEASTFSERLNLCLDKEGFPPKHRGRIRLLAEMVGLTHRGASKWVNGQTTPPLKKYEALAKQLKVDETWLRTGEGSMYGFEKPLFISGQTGILQDVHLYPMHQSHLDTKIPQQIISCVLPYRGTFFGVLLETEAMSPRFPQGSIIIFDAKAMPRDGDFVLLHAQGYPEPLFRQLLMMGSGIYLDAHNPKFDRLTLPHSHNVLGKMVQAILSFD